MRLPRVLALAGLTVAAACGPASTTAATARGFTIITSGRNAAMPGFVLTSPSFNADGSIPGKYTCDGENVSPALEWSRAPSDTSYFALVVEDPDAHDFVHWLAYNLTGSSSGLLPEAVSASPDAPPQGRNDFGQIGYGGPCPPSGTHRYRFTLYALLGPLELPGTPSAAQIQDGISGALLATATLEGTYTRRR